MRALRASTGALSLLLALGCGAGPARDLDALVLRDGLYLTPGTLLPHSGKVTRRFPGEGGGVQVEGTLRDGAWEGEFTVYHPSGRVRYEGVMSRGAPCGAWVENRPDEATSSVYGTLRQELESMGLYPPCPGG